MARKPTVKSGRIVAKVWPLFTEAVEAGIDYGWNRAHKHTPTPTEEQIKDAIQNSIELEVSERFNFVEENEE